MARTWDVFCSVVDNFGDIGVCWRLARQLSCELAQAVRLWVDDLASFHRLCRQVDPAHASQRVEGVEVRRWTSPWPRVEPADIVVEGFGVRLPAAYLEAMAARAPHPVWINLEHLSAESWVDGCHGLPSPHPVLPLVKHFFFPGFTTATGGLLMENALVAARDAFQNDAAAVAQFWRSLELAPPATREALRVSLFCYDNAALSVLVAAWSCGPSPVFCVVPEGTALTQLARITGSRLEPGSCAGQGSLLIAAVPFLEQQRFDRLLWACDLNFVRGEDSFVRAQLAARPLVWQAYPQDDGAHLRKTSAFLERYTGTLGPAAAPAYRALTDAWNRGSPDIGVQWAGLASHHEPLAAHARRWAASLVAGGSLAVKLAKFCEDRLQ